MKKRSVIIIVIFMIFSIENLLCVNYFREISPKSKNYSSAEYPISSQDNIDKKIMSQVNVDSLLKDQEEKRKSGIKLPLRFAYSHPANYNLNNSGTWDTLSSGRIWRLKIICPDAYTINMAFRKFYLPDRSLLHIYSNDYSYILGAFTKNNNNPDKIYLTDLIRGDTAIIEYYEPESKFGEGFFEISGVAHGFRDIFEQEKKTLKMISKKNDKIQTSTNCDRDIMCEEGDDLCLEHRAVTGILISSDGIEAYTFKASGCLLNNADNDPEKPYVLTANHALSSKFPNPHTRFRFSYFNSECNGYSQPEVFSYVGGDVVAEWPNTDFALIELDEIPAQGDKVYYAGWKYENPSTEPAPFVTCLHHPYGEPMKIAISNDFAVTDDHVDWPQYGNLYWRADVDDSGMEFFTGGSSGAPFFNKDRKVIAQHSGSNGVGMKCSAVYIYGGKFSESWIGGGTNSTQLKHWLAPNSTGDIEIDGMWRGSSFSEVNIYGRVHDPLVDLYFDPIYYTYFNYEQLNVGSGREPVAGDPYQYEAIPFLVKLDDSETDIYNPDFPVFMDLISKKRIRMRPCTKILAGSEFHAFIACKNEPVAEGSGLEYTTECSGIHSDGGPIIEDFTGSEDKTYHDNKNYLVIKPNPFTQNTNIEFSIAEESQVNVFISNLFGECVAKVITNETVSSNTLKSIAFNTNTLPAGVYYCNLQTNSFVITKKMILIK